MFIVSRAIVTILFFSLPIKTVNTFIALHLKIFHVALVTATDCFVTILTLSCGMIEKLFIWRASITHVMTRGQLGHRWILLSLNAEQERLVKSQARITPRKDFVTSCAHAIDSKKFIVAATLPWTHFSFPCWCENACVRACIFIPTSCVVTLAISILWMS